MNEVIHEDLEAKLRNEIDTAPWSALVRHFAFGRVYEVKNPLTLVEAALILHRDDRDALQNAMSQRLFALPETADVEAWQVTEQEFDVLVISPFVLVTKKP